jgi:hypothetical protein
MFRLMLLLRKCSNNDFCFHFCATSVLQVAYPRRINATDGQTDMEGLIWCCSIMLEHPVIYNGSIATSQSKIYHVYVGHAFCKHVTQHNSSIYVLMMTHYRRNVLSS